MNAIILKVIDIEINGKTYLDLSCQVVFFSLLRATLEEGLQQLY